MNHRKQASKLGQLSGAMMAMVIVSGCGAGVAKQEDYDAFWDQYGYEYLVGQKFSVAKSAFTAEPQPVADTSEIDVPDGHTLYEFDTSFDYVGYELSKDRATQLRANQAVFAGGGPGANAVAGGIIASPTELQRVNKTELCKLRFYVDENGDITRAVPLGQAYTIRFINPVPTGCTKRLNQLIGRAG